jgi:serine/threonine-protein kinase
VTGQEQQREEVVGVAGLHVPDDVEHAGRIRSRMSADRDTLLAGPADDGGGGEPDLVAGRYRIVRWLGGGGMGRVYAATDLELGVQVALKMLRSGLDGEALERFRREVRLTRRIQHPNVARMFDIGVHGDDKFLTMELVEGDSLAQLAGGRALAWARLQPLAVQICGGLAEAHAQHVLHRDLKPDNVLVERGTGRAVLTDFGIARADGDVGVTRAGIVVGTPRYMSPEQLAGGELDARSDVFSLGVMLFELATGAWPWPGDNPIAIAVAQVTTEPRSMAGADIPPEVAALVMQCLQIDPARRPASAAAIAAELARHAGGPAVRPTPPPFAVPTSPTTTLAVLPIVHAPADAYLADGLLEDLVVSLSALPGVRVSPAGHVPVTVASDPRALGRELDVDQVVFASIRRSPAGLRIVARMISVADGLQIWARRVDCAEADVLATSDELARSVAEALSSHASPRTSPMDPRAVELYLRARGELRRFWGTHAIEAAELLEQAAHHAPSSPAILGALAVARAQAWLMEPSAASPSGTPRRCWDRRSSA